jgi:hypothetical protein
MFTRAIFIRHDSELIRESVCACAKLFADEENVLKSNRGRTKTLTDSQENKTATYFLHSRLFTYDIMKNFNCN